MYRHAFSKLLRMPVAIAFTEVLACRPSATARRLSWVRKRGERVSNGHGASIDEPQRAAARRYADASRGWGAAPVASTNQIEVLPFRRRRH